LSLALSAFERRDSLQERLQKLIARAGIASRRRAEDLIRAGAVSVNGIVVTELGSKADAERDHIKVGGKLLQFPTQKLYFAFHKPAGCVATIGDPEGRPDLSSWLPRAARHRVFPVGRLDFHSDGLLLLTNDGEMANLLMRAAERIPQVYRLKLKRQLSPDRLESLARRTGVRLRKCVETMSSQQASNTWYEARFTSARSDALRRALLAQGHSIRRMRRVAIGNVRLENLAAGQMRPLSDGELRGLRKSLAGSDRKQVKGTVARSRTRNLRPAKGRGRR
jgi:pseudouridine synthase